MIVVCGPTASGKTALGATIAAEFDTEIISADSRQVYRGLDIGSGKDRHEYIVNGKEIPCHLIDIADPMEIYTLFHFQQDFDRVFHEVSGRGKLPVLCGGTGLYIEAVLRGYSIPTVPEDALLRRRLMGRDKNILEAQLRNIDETVWRRTDLNSKKRIVRAIEVALHGAAGEKDRTVPSPIRALVLCTRWERSELRERIDRRLAVRLSSGMEEEVRQLRESGIPDSRLAMLGMEYGHIVRYLRGETDHDTMVVQLRTAIHRLAKRQETYFRGMERRGVAMEWIDRADAMQAIKTIRRCLSSGALPAG